MRLLLLALLLVLPSGIAAQNRTEGLSVTVDQPLEARGALAGAAHRGTRVKGILAIQITAPDGQVLEDVRLNAWPNSGEQYLVDSWRGLQTLSNARFHGLGTSTTAFAETQTGCVAELTNAYQTDNQRAQGTLEVGGAPNIFRTVGVNVIDQPSITLGEFCLMTAQAVGSGVAITRIVITPVAAPNGSTVRTTYEVTFE